MDPVIKTEEQFQRQALLLNFLKNIKNSCANVMQFTLTSVIFFLFFNRFTCAHNSKIWNQKRMKETGENILRRAGHEQHTSDPRGTGLRDHSHGKGSSWSSEEKEIKLCWSFPGAAFFILDSILELQIMQNEEQPLLSQQVESHCQDKSHPCEERGCCVHPLSLEILPGA